MDRPDRPTIHYTELEELPPDDVHYHEWGAYLRELPRLLAEGQEGKWLLLKGDTIAGLFGTDVEAVKAGYERFLLQPFLVQQVREREPLIRLSWRCWPCQS